MRFLLCLSPSLAVLFSVEFAAAQQVVNSTYVDRFPEASLYSNTSHWVPAGVPNNTGAIHFNVIITPKYGVTVDIDATVSNLILGGVNAALNIAGRNFTVSGTTLNLIEQGPRILVRSTATAGATFNAGTLSAFSNRTLRGKYDLSSGGNWATLQFKGADIVTLGEGSLTLTGTLVRIIDENGNDALRSIAGLENGATLTLDGHNLAPAAPFTNHGTLSLGSSGMATIFTAAGSLTNFDAATRTLSGGSFFLGEQYFASNAGPIELRFPGADIVNNASSILLAGDSTRIADLAGVDALRNFVHNAATGSFILYERDFVTLGDFDNDGLITLLRSNFTVTGELKNFDSTTRTLSGGSYDLSGTLRFRGADMMHNGAALYLQRGGSITDEAGNNGLRNFNHNLANGAFTAGQGYHFTASGDFTNAGRIETYDYNFGIPEHDPGTFTVPAGFSYTQTAGTTINNGSLTADRIDIFGGALVCGLGGIKGDVTVSNATITPGFLASIDGNLTLTTGSHLHYNIGGEDDNRGSWREITGRVALAGTLDVELRSEIFLSSSATLLVVQSPFPLTGFFSNAPNGARITTVDGRGSFQVSYGSTYVVLNDFRAEPPPAHLLNISSRSYVSTGARVMICGFIITGQESKKVILRGIGPSIGPPFFWMQDPTIELRDSLGGLVAANNNWKETQQSEIEATGIAPPDDLESAIVATLSPGSYTVILRDTRGFAGTAVVETYDLSETRNGTLANLSTRGVTDVSNPLIGGFIAGDGPSNAEIVVRAIGPQLQRSGISDAVLDPALEMRDRNGALIASNDDWRSNEDQFLSGSLLFSLAPRDDRESAMHLSLPPGNYTALVRPKGNTSGVALVEFYDLRR